jgi:hypothetical protein
VDDLGLWIQAVRCGGCEVQGNAMRRDGCASADRHREDDHHDLFQFISSLPVNQECGRKHRLSNRRNLVANVAVKVANLDIFPLE